MQGNVYLRETDLDTEGLYRCEASAESPTFQTVEGEKMIKMYGKSFFSVDWRLSDDEWSFQVNTYCQTTRRVYSLLFRLFFELYRVPVLIINDLYFPNCWSQTYNSNYKNVTNEEKFYDTPFYYA